VYGPRAVLLIDTYDTVRAAGLVAASGLAPSFVRLDSGEIVRLSRSVRRILDRAGLRETGIFVSGDLDEDRIAAMLHARAPITGFGVGTAMSTSKDAPALGAVYKLVEIERDGVFVPTAKLSAGKRMWPGAKQVWRIVNTRGMATADILARADEAAPVEGSPLLVPVMRAGRRVHPPAAIEELRASCRRLAAQLPAPLRELGRRRPYRVVPSAALRALTAQVRTKIRSG
jgi:nicotinate phosphoribosyltransferase